MRNLTPQILLSLIAFAITPQVIASEQQRITELNAFWGEVARSVHQGDFAGYKATCHENGVLVNGITGTSYSLAKALAGWKQGFQDTKAGKIKAQVSFRFSQRIGDETTAHETGMFLYQSEDTDGKPTKAYIHFEALLIKEDRWRITMEYQKSRGTAADWERLK